MFFAWDQADLSPVAMAVLDQVQADLARGRPTRLTVADTPTARARSLTTTQLSERRAENVARALVQRGVPEPALEVEWFGERRPRIPTPDGEREPRNRRVEIVFGEALVQVWRPAARQPPVTLMWRLTAGLLWRRSMTKSWPLGLRAMPRGSPASSSSSPSDARSGARRSAASSWPRHMYSVPVQVSRTRLQLSQKLWVSGVMKPSRPPVSSTRT